MIYQILEMAVSIIISLWLLQDTTRRGLENKYRWGWIMVAFLAYYFYLFLGVLLVVIAYIIWSRYLYVKMPD